MKVLIIGGTKYFGKKVVRKLLDSGDQVTLLTRGLAKDNFGSQIERIVSDRRDLKTLSRAVKNLSWDVVLDQRCMNANDAKISTEIFADKTDHYVMTSSQSVYDTGTWIQEEEFDPYTYEFIDIADETKNYKEAKRQAEAFFAQSQQFKMSFVRPPIVLGTDDYTERLEFHIGRVLKGEPIYFPNLNAKISFISSDDAAEALYKICKTKSPTGTINIASKDPVRLGDLMESIENSTSTKPLYSAEADEKARSPFGINSDWLADVTKAENLGLKSADTKTWLPLLIDQTAKKLRS